MTLIYKDLTYTLRQCIFDVHNTLGTGYDEETYHQGLIHCLKGRKIPFRSKETQILAHRGVDITSFELDVIAYDKIILELKSLQSDFIPSNYVQIISYLKCWQKRLGLLINFGLPKAKIKRVPFTEKPKIVSEDYDYIKPHLTSEDREHLINLRQTILEVHDTYGLGFGESVYQKLIEVELDYREIAYRTGTLINVEYEGSTIRNYEMKFPLVENRFICGITAIRKRIDFYEIAKVQTYLKALGIHFGLLVNFGKTQLEIQGVYA